MTLLTNQNMQAPVGASANSPTVWGYSPSALHDLFWLSREVAIVRPGSGKPIDADAGLFLLVPEGKLFRLHLRLVLDQLFWMPRSVYFIGFYRPTRRQRTADIPNSSGTTDRAASAGTPHQASGNRGCQRPEPAARAALTPHRHIAEYWNTIPGAGNVWMALRRQYPDFGSIKVPGIVYDDTACSAIDYLQALSRDWTDPEVAIPGITQLARQVHGPIGFDMSMLKSHTRPLWIGHGSSSTQTTGAPGILPDAVPVGKPDESHCERK